MRNQKGDLQEASPPGDRQLPQQCRRMPHTSSTSHSQSLGPAVSAPWLRSSCSISTPLIKPVLALQGAPAQPPP